MKLPVYFQKPVILFPEPKKGHRRRVRSWISLGINLPENVRAKYPYEVTTVRLSVGGAFRSLVVQNLTNRN